MIRAYGTDISVNGGRECSGLGTSSDNSSRDGMRGMNRHGKVPPTGGDEYTIYERVPVGSRGNYVERGVPQVPEVIGMHFRGKIGSKNGTESGADLGVEMEGRFSIGEQDYYRGKEVALFDEEFCGTAGLSPPVAIYASHEGPSNLWRNTTGRGGQPSGVLCKNAKWNTGRRESRRKPKLSR